MKPQGGFLIAAILVLAIAAGCRRNDRPGEATHGGASRPASPAAPPGLAGLQWRPSRTRSTTAPASKPGLGEAKDELGELARDAELLRHALLHADFRGVDTAGDKAGKNEEADHDSR